MRVPTLLFAGAVTVALGACATAGTSSGSTGMALSARPDSSLLTPESLAEGRRLFMNGSCAQCHGPTGTGGMGGPNLADRDWLQTNGSFRGIVAIVTGGVNLADIRESSFRRPMPPRGGPDMNLTDEQVRAISAYVWTLSNPQQ